MNARQKTIVELAMFAGKFQVIVEYRQQIAECLRQGKSVQTLRKNLLKDPRYAAYKAALAKFEQS